LNWINLRTELLRSPEFITAKKGAIETWLFVLAYCCEQENNGVIAGSKAWSNEGWLRAMTLSKQEVIEAHPLVQETDDGYMVLGYPQSKQAEVEAKREAGKKGGVRSVSRSASRSAATEGEGEGEKKGKEKEKKNPLSGFGAFWDLYPRKVKKSKAEEAWVKGRCCECIEAILAVLPRQSESREWTKENGTFIPHPTTYLNQRRWEDEMETPQPKFIPFSAASVESAIQAQRAEDERYAAQLLEKARAANE